ncbi:MAG TPA: HEAT repeat domain-containing protein [Ktedonobacteraceae bacterium]|nr:HEAT repeat domain-containing protein [Ktedonobacteraceae bacterium]
MNQYMNTSLSGYSTRMMALLQHMRRSVAQILTRLEKVPLSELIVQIEEVTTPEQLNRRVNHVQEQLWNMPKQEHILLRRNLVDALTNHVLCSPQRSVRIEAARWLRLQVQAGFAARPADIFVTLVTAAVRVPATSAATAAVKEQRTYLKLLFECFWPFRHPYPAYTWEEFPASEIFYPLASLLTKVDGKTQEILMTIFAELPALNDREITDVLLPVALQWARHSDPEYRRIITNVLARISAPQAHETLQCLRADPDPAVRLSAQRVCSYPQQA